MKKSVKLLDCSGQSLVELIIALPLFFILIFSFNLILNQEIRKFTDISVLNSLKLSEVNFDKDEKIISYWDTANIDPEKLKNDILNRSFNPSGHFDRSVDFKNGAFLDKNYVKKSNHCENSPTYFAKFFSNHKFSIETCSDSSAYEKKNDFYKSIYVDFKNVTNKNLQGSFLFNPRDNFSWDERPNSIRNAVRTFLLSPNGLAFSRKIASLVSGGDFNTNCFMKPFVPNCYLQQLSSKFDRAAKDGANTQILECSLEMTAKCVALVVPSAILACEAEGAEEITMAILAGNAAASCPLVNATSRAIYDEVLLTSKVYSMKNMTKELYYRSHLF